MLALGLTMLVAAAAATAAPQVKSVVIEGNDRIEDAAIRRVIETADGDVYDEDALSADLEAIYNMGYFDDVRVSVKREEDGNTVIFTVKEKPTVRRIEFSGNRVHDDEKIKENIDISTGSILNIYRIKRNIEAIETLYQEKNYHNVSVSHEIKSLDHNQADLEFVIEEGEKVRIKEIIFQGNDAYDDDTLRDLMKTSEKGFFSWLTSSGDLDSEALDQDIMRLTAHYHKNGYAEARVADPEVKYKGDWIYITIKIDEGPRFKMGDVEFKGDMIRPKSELMETITIDEETWFNRQALQSDVVAVTDVYADEGFARADVSPKISKRETENVIDVVFAIAKGQPVYFEKIIIEGNTKTRDKVIRRELRVYEKDKYSSSRLKRSVRELYRLDYFEDVDVETTRGSAADQMKLKIDVKEKPTGTFSFGAGYSGMDGLYVMGSVQERNFLGLGQNLEFKVQTGSDSRQFRFSFTEPWLFDIPLSAGISAYNWERDYDDYNRDSKGGSLRLGYPLADYTRGYISYAYDVSEIDDVRPGFEAIIAEGSNVESSVTVSTVYDSRDRAINPSEGSKHQVSLQYAGLGGDIGFAKATAELGRYFPLIWDTRFFLHGEGGYVKEAGGKHLPDYEKFYLGGINSLRGFDWRDVSAIEVDEDGNRFKVGGEKFVQFNAEFIFPIIKKAGFMGLGFFDTGNVYKKGERVALGEMRESAGFGIRWYSPLGPIRLERGYILDRKKNAEGEYIEDSGRWEFAIGGAF
ncbi:MAG: outer membrane protein assembly factor BamA [Thermodesulfobacteriota bacterium]